MKRVVLTIGGLFMAASLFYSCQHAKYIGSVDANIDELYFIAGDLHCVGSCATDWVDKIKVKTPPKYDKIFFRIRAGSFISEPITPVYPFTEIELPNNGEKIVSIMLVADKTKLTGTLYRENEPFTLEFSILCGQKLDIYGITSCQLPVNSELEITVDMQELGNVAVISSHCKFQEVRKNVTGIQTFKIKGDFCPITIGVKDSSGKEYGTVILRTATKTYTPIQNPLLDDSGALCAPRDVNLMEIETNEKYRTIKRKKCTKNADFDTIYLWDNQNSRFRVILGD